MQISDEQKLAYLEQYAPKVWLAEKEEFFPSSVEWAFQYLERFKNESDGGRYWLRTKERLNSPSDTNLALFEGDLGSAPVYSFWVEKGPSIVDLIYFFYYPYNRGKKVADTMWGNHVSDWEHISVRLAKIANGDDLRPEKIYVSAHDSGGEAQWSDVNKEDTHPIVYSAWGSHGCYTEAGELEYKRIDIPIPFVDDIVLADQRSQGTAWNTWEMVEGFDYNSKTGLGSATWPNWMDTDYTKAGTEPASDPASGPIFRWGNPEDNGDDVGGQLAKWFSKLTGESRLNDGPTGPPDKNVWAPSIFE